MELAELAVQKALSKGATEAEAYIQKTKRTKVEFADEIENFKTTHSLGITLRVAIDRKTARYSTSVLDKEEIDEAAAKTVKIAEAAPEDPHWEHMNQKFGDSPAEGYYDPQIAHLKHREIVQTITSAIDRMKDYDPRVKPTRGFLAASVSQVSIANSYHHSCQRRETGIGVWMRTKAEESGMKSTGSEHKQARFWKEVDFPQLADKAAEKAVRFLKAKPSLTGKMPVIIRNQIFANIVGVVLSGPINADWVQKGRSPLADKLGTSIASEDVHIFDDGVMHGGWRTKPFDDEGHPTQRTPIVEGGVLKNYLYDTYTALKEDRESTGNAQRRRYWMEPQPLPNNLILKPGEATREEIIQETQKGLYIEETIGEWLSNPVSGNLNATVTHGYLVEDGELQEPVKGVVISGDFYQTLQNGIELIGNDLRNSRQNYSPTVKLTELTIAGKEE